MIGAGDLRERITIQQNTEVDDGQGGRSSSWGTLAIVWAEVRPLSGNEMLALREFLASTGAYMVTIRYRADVTPKMRISWTPARWTVAKALEIHGVQPTPDRAFLTLTCAEVL